MSQWLCSECYNDEEYCLLDIGSEYREPTECPVNKENCPNWIKCQGVKHD